MAFVRAMFFLPASLARHYESLASRAGVSRSLLARYALEQSLAAVEEYARSGRAAAARESELSERRGARSREAVPASRPAASAPSAPADEERLVASVEQLVYRQLQETPNLDAEALKRLVAGNVETLLGVPPDSKVLDDAVRRIVSARPHDPPQPVGGNRPPE